MDTSETYIKMCGKAKEMQKNLKLELGSFYVQQKDGGVIIYASDEREYLLVAPINGKGSYVLDEPISWLPRQDQLQEMVGDYEKQLEVLDEWREGGLEPIIYWNIGNLKSWEQLWLSLAMKEKYNKTWSGTEWT